MYVYIIGNKEQELYKIGISKQPNKRLSEIQTGNPYKLEVLYTFKTKYANEVETDYHNLFSEYRD